MDLLIYESRKQELINKHRVRERSSRGREVIILAGSAVLSFLVYGRGLFNGFVAEDFNMIALSTVDWARLCKFLIEETRIKPLPLLLNKAIYPLFGTNPVGYHLMSLVLYTRPVRGVWCNLAPCWVANDASDLAGLLFAVYPRHHQTVLWLAARPAPGWMSSCAPFASWSFSAYNYVDRTGQATLLNV